MDRDEMKIDPGPSQKAYQEGFRDGEQSSKLYADNLALIKRLEQKEHLLNQAYTQANVHIDGIAALEQQLESSNKVGKVASKLLEQEMTTSGKLRVELAEAQQRIAALEDWNRNARQCIEELQQERDRLQAQLEEALKLLKDDLVNVIRSVIARRQPGNIALEYAEMCMEEVNSKVASLKCDSGRA